MSRSNSQLIKCVCVCACVRACVRVCVHVCIRMRERFEANQTRAVAIYSSDDFDPLNLVQAYMPPLIWAPTSLIVCSGM